MRSILHDEHDVGLGRPDQLTIVLALVGVTDDVDAILDTATRHHATALAV